MGESFVEEPVIEGKMGDTAAGVGNLEVSISFGRFENDLLSWERWSSFSQNKHMEEVEKCSTPGSVAKKKAYFEAHYKKIAAKKAEIEDQQKQLEASLLMVAKNNSESSIVTKKVETENKHTQLEADSSVEERPTGESPAAVNSETVNQLKQVEEVTLIAEPSRAYPIQSTQGVTSDFPSSESQTDNIQLVQEIKNLNNEPGSTNIDERKADGDTKAVLQTTITGGEKQESNLASETLDDIVKELEHETRLKDSPRLGETLTEADLVFSEVLKSSTKEMTKLKPKRMTKVLLTNTERNVTKVKKAPVAVTAKSPQISSSTPEKWTPRSTPSMISSSRSLAMKGSKSSVSSSNSSYAERKKLAPRTDTVSLSPHLARSAPVTATRKTTIMEKTADKDAVKRAFKSFQPNSSPMASPGERSDSLPNQVSRNAKEIKVREPLTSQKGKEWLQKTGVINENAAQAAPFLASSRSDTMAQKGKAMKKVNGNPNVKVVAGSHILAKSKEEKETTIKDLKQSYKFKATPLPLFYRGAGVSKTKECPKSQLH